MGVKCGKDSICNDLATSKSWTERSNAAQSYVYISIVWRYIKCNDKGNNKFCQIYLTSNDNYCVMWKHVHEYTHTYILIYI